MEKETEKCQCEEISCKVDCLRNHTHKTFWCEKCHPERYPITVNQEVAIHQKENNWQKKFLETGTANGLCDLSVMVSTVSEIIDEAIKEERNRFLEILEDNRNETLWGDDDSNEVMKDSINNFVVAVKDSLVSKENE